MPVWLQLSRFLNPTRSRRGLRCKAVAIALATWAVTALIRLPKLAPGADPAPDLRLPSRFTGTFLRQPPITRGAAVTLEDSSRNTCVMALGKNAKLSVGYRELTRDTIVSSPVCDLYNASGEDVGALDRPQLVGALNRLYLRVASHWHLEPGGAAAHLATLLDGRIQGRNRFQTPKSTGYIADKRCRSIT